MCDRSLSGPMNSPSKDNAGDPANSPGVGISLGHNDWTMPSRDDLYTLISLYSPEAVVRMINLGSIVPIDHSVDAETMRETVPSPSSATVPAPKVSK